MVWDLFFPWYPWDFGYLSVWQITEILGIWGLWLLLMPAVLWKIWKDPHNQWWPLLLCDSVLAVCAWTTWCCVCKAQRLSMAASPKTSTKICQKWDWWNDLWWITTIMQARETRSMHLGNRFFFQVLCCLLEDQRELRYLFGSQSCLACLICWWNNLEEVEMDSTCPL